ncbi:MAG: glucose-1-phosphate adenylyltransferase subunit GlgD [Desulfotomaculaceae bacterium]|nr:glucose-1-phosphate adenylyltransferase subunit GlgD [Desulfotomaculaceae bacterium]
MNRTIGIIFGNRRSNFLQGIDKNRPLAVVPFGGRYRLLDFALSSMVNSGIRTVGIITPSHYRPILNQLGAGKEWMLDRKSGGLFILPGINQGIAGWESLFLLKDLAKNIEYLENDFSEYVVLCGCNQIFNIDYNEAIVFHELSMADVTFIYKDIEKEGQKSLTGTYLKMLADGKVCGFMTDEEIFELAGLLPVFIDMVIINRKLLMEIVAGYESIENIGLLDVLIENKQVLSIFGFPYKGYFARIESVSDYFQCNMDLLNLDVRKELFWGTNRVYTKIRDNPPTRYSGKTLVRNSLVASGCNIMGVLENSIISRSVQIADNTQIKNSIIMKKCDIGKGVILENVIMDKYVIIKEGTVLKGQEQAPIVVNKSAVV